MKGEVKRRNRGLYWTYVHLQFFCLHCTSFGWSKRLDLGM